MLLAVKLLHYLRGVLKPLTGLGGAMFLKRLFGPVIILLILIIGWHAASGFMVAKAIAPPNAPTSLIVRMMLRPRYQMATPHRSLITEIKLAVVLPKVQACGAATCDGTEKKSFCGLEDCHTPCPPGHCWCPGCSTSGCTNWCCPYVGHATLCQDGFGTTPCTFCALSNNVACTP